MPGVSGPGKMLVLIAGHVNDTFLLPVLVSYGRVGVGRGTPTEGPGSHLSVKIVLCGNASVNIGPI